MSFVHDESRETAHTISSVVERERRLLAQIARGVPLAKVLDDLLRTIESQSPRDLLASVLFVSEDGRHLRHGAAPSLPDAYNDAVDGIAIGEGVGSCGTAAARGEPVYVTDIASDPLWRDFKDLAGEHGLKACWSTPIVAAEGRVLGTFAVYFKQPCDPSLDDLELIAGASQTAGLAIERHLADCELREVQQELRLKNQSLADQNEALREQEALYRFLDELSGATAALESADDILSTTTHMVAEHLGLSNCAYADMDEDQDGFTIRGNWHAPGSPTIVGHYSLADFGTLAVQELGAARPLIVNDNLAELAPEEAKTFRDIGIAATICMPLVKNGRLTALMAIHDKVPRQWSERELTLIQEVTQRSWAHVERVGVQAELRASAAALTDLNATLEMRVEERTRRLMQAEDALRQSQKLEAVGQLTGGLAHDFNNLLTVIRGSVELLRRPTLEPGKRERYIDAIADTAERASKLTSQLLAFARRQALSPKLFDVAAGIEGIRAMIGTLIGSRIAITVSAPDEACVVDADPNQFETAIINMVANARDAMRGEGTLTVEVARADEIPASADAQKVEGAYVAVSLTDSGPGIEPESIDRIFEPFFTTKALGHGTGLGLSQVFGFAKQSGGEIRVKSAAGAGATFTLFLPRVDGEAVATTARDEEQRVDGRGACVLVVEDNAEVGEFAVQALAELGYETMLTTDAQSALAILSEGADRFHVVFSDVVMPGMNGVDFAREVEDRFPGLPVVLASGYSTVLAQGAKHDFELLNKPYSIEQLSRILHSASRRWPGKGA